MKVTQLLIRSAAAMAVTCVVAVSAQADDAKALYDKNCAACHGTAGKGDGPGGKMLKPPPQDFAAALKGKADADIAKVIKEGGKAVGKAASMPGYGKKLTDDQINALVEYSKNLSK